MSEPGGESDDVDDDAQSTNVASLSSCVGGASIGGVSSPAGSEDCESGSASTQVAVRAYACAAGIGMGMDAGR